MSAFEIDDAGNIVGPGFFLAKENQPIPGMVVFDVALLNQFYAVAQSAGRLTVDEGLKLARDRIEDAKATLESEHEGTLCWRCFRKPHAPDRACDIDSATNPAPPWRTHG